MKSKKRKVNRYITILFFIIVTVYCALTARQYNVIKSDSYYSSVHTLIGSLLHYESLFHSKPSNFESFQPFLFDYLLNYNIIDYDMGINKRLEFVNTDSSFCIIYSRLLEFGNLQGYLDFKNLSYLKMLFNPRSVLLYSMEKTNIDCVFPKHHIHFYNSDNQYPIKDSIYLKEVSEHIKFLTKELEKELNIQNKYYIYLNLEFNSDTLIIKFICDDSKLHFDHPELISILSNSLKRYNKYDFMLLSLYLRPFIAD